MTTHDMNILKPAILKYHEFTDFTPAAESILDSIATYCISHNITPDEFTTFEQQLLSQ